MILTGVVDAIIFRNPETGYTVLEIETKQGTQTVVGILPPIGEGEQIEVEGDYTNHSVYGRQFAAETFRSSLPADETSIFRYLSSGIIKGVRAVTAKNFINAFGPDTLDVLENDPEKTATVKGMSLDRAIQISEQMKSLTGVKSILMGLAGFGITPSDAFGIYRQFGVHAYELVRLNPYRLCDISGFGFEKADKIAKKMQYPENDVNRIRAGVLYVLKHNLYNNGHTFQPREKLIAAAQSLLDVSPDEIDIVIDRLEEEKEIVTEHSIGNTNGVYWFPSYNAEKIISERVSLVSRFEKEYPGNFENDICKAETALGIQFAENQKTAVKNSLCYRIMVLTGGPGTGKTTTLNGIIYNFEQKGISFALAAPTGRAAKRMTELTGKEAKTIHRLLEYGEKGTFAKNRENTLQYDAVIIDESSMVDLFLFSALIQAMNISATLILVGDANQLPPVGPGCVFKDIIASGAVSVVELNEIFRQSRESMIVTNAHAIINGNMPECRDKKHDFFFIPSSTPEDLAMTVSDLYTSRLPRAYGFDPMTDIQIICPTKKTLCGTVSLNAMLKELANPQEGRKNEMSFHGTVFREGDKVMQTRNNYEIVYESDYGIEDQGVFNGDIGKIEKITGDGESMIVRFDDKTVTYYAQDLEDIDLAYAITVHKSQGSEWDAVILPLMDGYDALFTRNLLYTAVTRAKKILVIVGSYERLKKMVENQTSDKRYCGLKYMILKML
jgi:exodeoxyribonuclease V alpha subunit